jgi:hypothetical protein
VTKRSPAAERLYQVRRAAAKELGLKVTDPKVIRLATLQAAYDQVQAQIAAGRVIDIDNMLKIDTALAGVRASAATNTTPKVELVIVEQLHGICQKCGHSQPQPAQDHLPPEPLPPPDAEARLKPFAAPTSPTTPANVVELRPR